MADVERDRWGRYKLPHPVTGAEQAWTRTTTLTKTLDDMTAIFKADMRNVVLGIVARPDLYALACATEPDDKQQLGQIVEKAKSAARADAKSHHGTAMHGFADRVDSGRPTRAPDVFGQEIDAYKNVITANNVRMSSEFMERITVVPEVEAAGTLDRIAQVGSSNYIGDLKTGQELGNSWMNIAMQLGTYSRGSGLWNPAKRVYDPMPQVDQSNGIVVHVPAGRPDDAAVYWVNIAAGWEMVKVAYMVRGWRKRDDYAKPF